jgi:murein DD-endopeptidase MepM/ murein hydrolase activator NlpD
MESNIDSSNTKSLNFIVKYFAMRIRQTRLFTNLVIQFLLALLAEIKILVVRRMYWGRTSFYKASFHILVLITTISAIYFGIGTRIVATQRSEIANISVSSGFINDSDIVYQSGKLFPLSELNEESDRLFQTYTVQSGDSLSSISDANQVQENTIRWANGIPSGRDTLRVGQVIKIPVIDGVLYEVKSGDTVDKILSNVELQDKESDRLTFLELNADVIGENESLQEGTQVLIADASIKEKAPPVVAPRPTTGTATGTVSPPPSVPGPATGFVNPMQLSGGYRFSRGYFSSHTGVDLALPSGRTIVAAGAGTVIVSGWCASLGYCVGIAHAGGYQSLYGHGNGVLYVQKGQTVSAGQPIMQSGCTGNCYGSHVHISLTRNNQDVYGCYYCRINPAGIIPY